MRVWVFRDCHKVEPDRRRCSRESTVLNWRTDISDPGRIPAPVMRCEPTMFFARSRSTRAGIRRSRMRFQRPFLSARSVRVGGRRRHDAAWIPERDSVRLTIFVPEMPLLRILREPDCVGSRIALKNERSKRPQRACFLWPNNMHSHCSSIFLRTKPDTPSPPTRPLLCCSLFPAFLDTCIHVDRTV